jgi:hypothetical protein
MRKTIEEAEARHSLEGLLLGNYHYHVDVEETSDGERTHIYLTRYNEECDGCKYWDDCYGDDPEDDCQANNMPTVYPYCNTYSLTYYRTLNVLADLDYGELNSELTDMDKLAIILAADCTDSERAYEGVFKKG